MFLCSGGDKGWHVFYHFVGAVPGSTELDMMLKRLLMEINVISVSAYITVIYPVTNLSKINVDI